MDFHEQQIQESIDFRISNHRKSMEIRELRSNIPLRQLGVSQQTWYLGLLASHALHE